MSETRIEAAAEVLAKQDGWLSLRHPNPQTQAALRERAAEILADTDKADPLRDRKELIIRMGAGISKSHATQEPILSIEENGGMISIRLPDLADVILGQEAAA